MTTTNNEPRNSAVLSNDGLSDGRAAHIAWESDGGQENECDAERRLADDAEDSGADMQAWREGWFERSDAWRDEIGHESDNAKVKGGGQ